MANENYFIRNHEVINGENLKEKITVIGAGAVGSVAVLGLAKLGFDNIEVWDSDVIEEENIGPQMYPTRYIGNNKAKALEDLVHSYTGTLIRGVPEAWRGESLSGIIVSAVDSMKVRKQIWEESQYFGRLVVDPRMAVEFASCYAARPADKWYEKTLHSDENSVQERCTNKATSYTSFLLGAHVVKVVKDFVRGMSYCKNLQFDISKHVYQASMT